MGVNAVETEEAEAEEEEPREEEDLADTAQFRFYLPA
jgi:hypothetical protein